MSQLPARPAVSAPAIRPSQPTSQAGARYDAAEASDQEHRRAIQDIQALNVTARTGFLEQFTTDQLRDYLAHLRHARHKHVRLPGWVQRRCEALAEARRTMRKAG